MELSPEQLNAATALIERGVNRELAGIAAFWLEPPAVKRTIAWYDAEQKRRDVGPGVLVAELRKGGAAAADTSLLERQVTYGREIVDWLRKHFPQWNRDDGNRTHTAAIACVTRLHHRHGRGELDPREHGAEIRAAVANFEANYGPGTGGGKGT